MRTKASVRKESLHARDTLDPAYRREASERIWVRLSRLPEFRRADTVYFYSSFRSEVETPDMIRLAMDLGKKVCIPKVVSKEDMIFIMLGEDTAVAEGAYGIPEPVGDAPAGDAPAGDAPSDFVPDVIIMPCAAADIRGNRIGYGAGYYDRYLCRIPECTRICLAFECQMTDEFETEETDIGADIIITEERTVRI